MPEVYDQLRALAGSYFRGRSDGHTLQPTALVNEAYLKLAKSGAEIRDRSHFFAIAATAMRQILTDHARKVRASKRGGELQRVTMTGQAIFEDQAAEQAYDLLALEDLITKLESVSERQAKVVELRLFGGMSCPEVAEALGASLRTVEREWRFARAWLKKHLHA